ncbi:hypothetical protein Taro_020473 [Colocasia esculenta]|uniref:Uncharacterized protein n=1 Tax=Colocasia esculenta TaxID=4460 RepID=A0A843UNS8_COLES|nr:hypothetical protein [Colocasia esculenta]
MGMEEVCSSLSSFSSHRQVVAEEHRSSEEEAGLWPVRGRRTQIKYVIGLTGLVEAFRHIVDVLMGGVVDAQDHSITALFNLSMDDNNNAALDVLGTLPPLLYLLS